MGMDPKNLKAFAAHGSPPMPFPGKGTKGGVTAEMAEKKGPGGEGSEEESNEELVARVGAEVESGKKDLEIVRLMVDFDPEVGDGEDEEEPPRWAVDADTWDRAVEAVDPEGYGEDEWDDPWMVVAHVYQAMGGKIDPAAEEKGEDEEGEDEDEEEEAGEVEEPNGEEDYADGEDGA